MKKYLLLFLMAGLVSLSACSSDDDGVQTIDPIVGTWEFKETNVPGIDPDACDDDSTITFNENGTGNGTFYLGTSECEPESSPVSWTENNNVYSIQVPIPIVGNQEGTVEFENNNNRFVFSPQGFPGATLTFDRVE